MDTKVINTTFKYFTTPFVEGNRARNDALENDSLSAARRAHLYCLAQIIVSVISIPFLILAGLYDILKGNANVFDMPKAIVTQLFLILPLSVIGAIFPLSVSKKLDGYLDKRTQQRQVECLRDSRSLPSLQQQLNTSQCRTQQQNQLKTIEQLDLEKAIFKKTEQLRNEADQTNLETLEQALAGADSNTDLYADQYEILKIKQQKLKRGANQSTQTLLRLLTENDPATIVHKDTKKSLAEKIAKGNRTIPILRADIERGRLLAEAPTQEARAAILANADNDESRAIATSAMDPVYREAIETGIIERYIYANSLAALEAVLAQLPQEDVERASITQAIEKKQHIIRQYLRSESIEKLKEQQRLAPQHRIFLQDFDLVVQRKNDELNALAENTLEKLKNDLEQSKNPAKTGDFSEAIQRHYCKNFSFVQLELLAKNDPDNSLLIKALETKTRNVELLVEASTLEILLNNPPDPEPAIAHTDRMEAIQRKYSAIKTLDELEVLHAENPGNENIEKALQRKQSIIQSLLNTCTLEELLNTMNREPNPRKRAELQTACVKKLAEINQLLITKTRKELHILLNTTSNDRIRLANYRAAINQKEAHIVEIASNHTFEQLQQNEGVDPLSPIASDDWQEATQYKDQLINRLINENTLQQLQAFRERNDLSPIVQNDLDLAIQGKTLQEELLAPAPDAALAPFVPAPVV